MIAGAGKIGRLIACLLNNSNDYNIHLVDLEFKGNDVSRLLKKNPSIQTVVLDITNQQALEDYIRKYNIVALVSSLPYFLNIHIAKAAKASQTHYFDLTEDTAVTEAVRELAKNANNAFVPQCGLAPGFISIAANSMMQEFDVCYQAKLRVGALPQHSSNALHYSLTWSTDGIINEYGNLCYGIENAKLAILKPLEGLELIQIDGCQYEAFNTSGGLGSLSELYLGKIQNLNYKTIRYPGHCEKMRLLMNDLKLNEDRPTFKRILEKAIPKTQQDLVIAYIAVEGLYKGEFYEKSYVKKLYPQIINELEWSAIQVSTAASICAVTDLVLTAAEKYHGFIPQEKFELTELLANRFGQYYA